MVVDWSAKWSECTGICEVAEFCGACAPKYGMLNDFANDCRKNETIKVLCEGCGWVIVDHTGYPTKPTEKNHEST